MGALVFVLAFVLLAAGAVSGYLSLDLLPTSPGLLYAFAGAVAAVGAVVVFALGVVAVRLGRLTQAVRAKTAAAEALGAGAPAERAAAAVGAASAETDAATGARLAADALATDSVNAADAEMAAGDASSSLAEAERDSREAGAAQAEATDDDEALNENRAGHLPTLDEIERAIETPEAPPTLIGRYSSGGATYMIFSDGSIEAETDQGAFKFASMGDFKQFLVDRDVPTKG